MTTRGMNLLGRDPDSLEAILLHPFQLEACERLRRLISDLRGLKTPAQYFEFQLRLFQEVYSAQEAQAEAARNVVRVCKGRPVPEAPLGDWEVERSVRDRIVYQFRSVGDALAWRLFDYDRRFFLALSRNAPVSPMVGRHGPKEGLLSEVEVVKRKWEQDRNFCLLHDLTNSVRIGDLTEVKPEGLLLTEVKKSPGRTRSAQMKRMQRVIDILTAGAPLVDTAEDRTELFRPQVPFKTYLRKLERVFAMADRDGVSSIPFGHQWVVTSIAADSGSIGPSVMQRWEQVEGRAFHKAGMYAIKEPHHLVGVRVDSAADDPSLAPFTIYPFNPATCARLTCDLLTYKSVIAWDRVARAFEDEGFATECRLPKADVSDPLPDGEVLTARRGEAQITMHNWGMNQLLFELVDPRAYAAAAKELLARTRGRRSGVLVFANERAVWR